MNPADTEALHEFRWIPQPAAAELVSDLLNNFRRRIPWLDQLGRRMSVETGTRLIDWIDHFVVPQADEVTSRLQHAGFAPLETNDTVIWRHPGGLFPNVVVMEGESSVSLKVDSVSDFLFAQRPPEPRLEGEPLSAVRRARAAVANDAQCWSSSGTARANCSWTTTELPPPTRGCALPR